MLPTDPIGKLIVVLYFIATAFLGCVIGAIVGFAVFAITGNPMTMPAGFFAGIPAGLIMGWLISKKM